MTQQRFLGSETKRKRFLAALLAVCMLFTFGQAAEFSPALEAQLESAKSGEFVSAIVILESPVDIRALDLRLHEQRIPLAERHHKVIEALKYNAKDRQPPFIAELEAGKEKGELEGYTAYWIENLVVISATLDYIKSLRPRGDIKYVTENFGTELISPIDNRSNRNERLHRSSLDETTTDALLAIGATRVNHELGLTGAGVLVANLDTGVDGDHPALHSRWRGQTAPTSECWLDVLGASTYPIDNTNHGTHVMGTIIGREITGTDTITIGVAPNAQWIACNAIGQPAGDQFEFDNDVIAAFQWFIDPDGNSLTMDDVPDVLENSWGVFHNGYTECYSYWNTVALNLEAAGTVAIWSAGNEGLNSMRSPASFVFSDIQMFSVGAVDVVAVEPPAFEIAFFSSRGPTPCTPVLGDSVKPEISAPGVQIYSSVPGGGYESEEWDGTSMAGPHVAGVVALMREACPDCDPITIKEALLETAQDQGAPGNDNEYGMGVVDAYAAVLLVLNKGMLSGTVMNDSSPLDSVLVEAVGESLSATTSVTGEYLLEVSPGLYTIRIWKFGFEEQVFTDVEISAAVTTTINADLVMSPTATVDGYVLYNDLNPVAEAEIRVGEYPVVPVLSNPDGSYELILPMGLTYELTTTKAGEGSAQAVVELNGTVNRNFILPTLMICYDFESDNGWTSGAAGDNATAGNWESDDPDGILSNGNKAVQPEDDHTVDPFAKCWVTDGEAGPTVDIGDVEGGRTTLLSPIWDLSAVESAQLELWTWYSNDEGSNPGEDAFRIDISNDGGETWHSMLNTTDDWEVWRRSEFILNDFISLTDSIRVRVIASDEGIGSSLVEAAVDDACLYIKTAEYPAPAELSIYWNEASLLLTWEPVLYAGHYEVWKFNELPFTADSAAVIGQPADTCFVDTDVNSGEAGYYVVRACP